MTETLTKLSLIALAGSLGALSRYGMQLAARDILGHTTVLGTFVVNISGAFLIGLLFGLAEDHLSLSNTWRLTLSVGFLGAYTTFSTLMFDSVDSIERGDAMLAIANLTFSILFGLLAVYAGLSVGRAV